MANSEKIRALDWLKNEIEEEETRSHVRQKSEKDTKGYDYRRGLRYALRKIEEIEKEKR